MKKIFYSLFIAAFCCLTIASCTEEEVTPNNQVEINGGGDISVERD